MFHIAWNTPITWSTGQVVTASQMNSQIKDNFNATAVAKATASGRIIVPNGTNSMVERIPTMDYTGTSATTTNTSYANLTASVGPVVTVTTGTAAQLILTAGLSNSTVNAEAFMGCQISGATTVAANDNEALRHTSATAGAQMVGSWCAIYPLTAGSNVFTAKYRASSGTTTGFDRRVSVLPF